ncbi:UNVERIFIED_CONTAM: hypothetical protein FKN15_019509 [Acipenser sinensis]
MQCARCGPYCNRTWDGWLCWDDSPAGTYTSQNCPNYFPDFDSTEKATKFCDETGSWFRHPESNRTWSNYTLCIAYTTDKLKMAYILYYMAIVGHALSIASLLISLGIFFYFKVTQKQMAYMLGRHGVFLELSEDVEDYEDLTEIMSNVQLNSNFLALAREVNLFFLLNIVRVLVTKLRDTHRAESNMYMKAVRATLILVPLLGIQFVIIPWRPENRLAGEIYDYIMHILMHYQVQAALRRQWMQYKAQWGQRRRDHCSMRSTSYTATSITEVPAYLYHHDCRSEHLNGTHSEDSELAVLRSAETYA